MEGCTCCAYLNHMFNAERIYDEAGEIRKARLDSVPDETQSSPTPEESQKYDKVIEKSSRVLERFPKNEKRTAEAVFLIGESYRHKREWSKAITKYDEFERYFADHDSMRTVEYQRAYCLYRNQEFNICRFALEPVVASKDHPYYFQGLNLLSLLDEKSEASDQAIASLEAMLADTAGTDYMRGKVHFRLAGLYYKAENWEKARLHYKAKEVALLSVRERETAGEQAIESLANMKEYLKAADEYKELYKSEEFEKKRPLYLVRIGELIMLGDKYADAKVVLQKVNADYEKTEYSSRSYFDLGDYEQFKRMDYEKAMAYYDSSFIARSISEYARKSRERRDALKRLILLRNANDKIEKKDSIPNMGKFFSSEFQMAELFLFKLSESDSAVARLTKVIEHSDDTAKVMRAAYARAFIYDEFKNDPDTAEELYKEIIEKYPNTEYAKQAQVNLGMRVSMKTEEDVARERFMEAESLWTVASEVPLNKMDEVDSAYARAFNKYDQVYTDYPKTQAGIQALYMKAVYYQMNLALDSAAKVYRQLRQDYPNTPWGKQAALLLVTRLSTSDEDMDRQRRRTKEAIERLDKQSAAYYEELRKPPEEKKAEVKSQEDEVLENTYNSMYDFE